MSQDKNTLLGVLAVARGWAQPAEVLAAHQAIGVDPRRTLARELSLSPDRELELEEAAQEALDASGGNVQKAIDALRPAASSGNAAQEIAFDEGDENTISIETSPLKSLMGEAGSAGDGRSPEGAAFGDENEPTKVLDWDRNVRKSLK